MTPITLNISGIKHFVQENELLNMQNHITTYYKQLIEKKGKGNDFLGWLDLPEQIHQKDFINDIIQTAEETKSSDVIVVIGIGGSYLGAKAIIEALRNPFLTRKNEFPEIIFAGQHLSEDYLSCLLSYLDNKDYKVIVISKSGTTTEPAIAFRLLKKHLEKKYEKKEVSKRIIAITDKNKGILRRIAEKENYKTFIIPDDVGGRYSVLTPVGLLPVAAAGYNIEKLLEGALDTKKILYTSHNITENPACLYAAIRNILYNKTKYIEILVNFDPQLALLTEWWKQLFGESEGKEHKGIFPAGVHNTTDLHSLGQYIQEGLRVIFETMISVRIPNYELSITYENTDDDGLNFISGKRINEINKQAALGTKIAHIDGGVPVLQIEIEKIDEYHLGALMYFFEFSCALSGYLLGINPFDQPGVEAYKNNMFALLGKPGYEKLKQEIEQRINLLNS